MAETKKVASCFTASLKNIKYTALIFLYLFSGQAFAKDKIYINGENGRHYFNVEIADSEDERSKGLMFRDKLGDDEGMLFLLPEPVEAHMWMKNTPLKLDVIFIDNTGKINEVLKKLEPNREDVFISKEPVVAILEIKGGTTERLGIKEGNTVHHKFFSNYD